MSYRLLRIAIALGSVMLIQGCAIFGIELGVHRTVSITKPPYQIVMSGDIQKEDYRNAIETLKELKGTKYHPYAFKPVIVQISGKESTLHLNENRSKGDDNEKYQEVREDNETE